MAFKDNIALIETFKSDLEDVKSISLIKHRRIDAKTFKYVNEIEQNTINYPTDSDIDIRHKDLIDKCNEILTFFVDLDDMYLSHWK